MSRKHKHVPEIRMRSTRGAGFWLAVLVYLLLLFMTRTLSLPLFLLSFVLLPLLIGFVAARGTQQIHTIRQRFMSGFWACGVPAALYTAIQLLIAHSRVGPSPSASIAFLIGLFVMFTYALLAGIVAGTMGAVFYHHGDRVGGSA